MRVTLAIATLAAAPLWGCARAPNTASVLPLTSVRLYETGVGYFERSGILSPSERTGLPVPASHLDDALQSLVVYTPGRADPVRGVTFRSRVSGGMARAMAGLPTDSKAPLTYQDLLASLKGAHIEVTTHAGVSAGRLAEIESSKAAETANATAPQAAASLAGTSLVVLTDGGALLRVPMEDVKSVRPTDPAYGARLDAALDALSPHSAESRKMLDVLGASRGPVTLGYVAETPVWRTTYRLVLEGDTGRGKLQGWALVHNDTDEDWDSVKVELVNGHPDSFLFPLAAPRYARRALVHPGDQLSTVPQLLDQTADAAWGDNIDDASSVGGLSLSGVGEGGGGAGEGGEGLATFNALGDEKTSAKAAPPVVLRVGDLARVPQASGVEAGALFIYSLPDRLALRAHASALAPFLDQRVEVLAIAWVESENQPARAAVRFVNSTSQTLPAGTIAFFSDGGFAGQSGLDRLKPGERRIMQFGLDVDVSVKALPEKTKPALDSVERLTFGGGLLSEHVRRTTDSTYVFENRSGHGRAVYFALPVGANATMTGPDAIDFDQATERAIAILRVGPKARVEREIVTVEGLTFQVAVGSLSAEALASLVLAPNLAAADKAIAKDALARQGELEDTRRALQRARDAVAAIEKELERLRDDAKAVGGERGAATPEFANRLLAAEDRHDAAVKRREELESEEKTRAESVRATLAKLTS